MIQKEKETFNIEMAKAPLIADESSEMSICSISAETSPWIDVKDRLPEIDKIVLVALNLSSTPLIVGRHKNAGKFTCSWDGQVLFSVTHWMPLPEPPKINKNEKI